MCEVKVYLLKDGKEDLILESLDFLRDEQEKIVISNIIGEKKELKASFKEFDNSQGKIILLPK